MINRCELNGDIREAVCEAGTPYTWEEGGGGERLGLFAPLNDTAERLMTGGELDQKDWKLTVLESDFPERRPVANEHFVVNGERYRVQGVMSQPLHGGVVFHLRQEE